MLVSTNHFNHTKEELAPHAFNSLVSNKKLSFKIFTLRDSESEFSHFFSSSIYYLKQKNCRFSPQIPIYMLLMLGKYEKKFLKNNSQRKAMHANSKWPVTSQLLDEITKANLGSISLNKLEMFRL